MNTLNKIDEYLNEKNEYDAIHDILSKSGVIAIKGSTAIASSILTLEAEKKFLSKNTFKNGNDYIVDYELFQKISKENKKILKKWHKDNNLPYYGK